MTILRCKMCGGDIQATDATFGTCQSCGSTTTLPKASDERKANLYNRADHYRRQNEFDKAIQAFENILNEDSTEAEAHWGIVLSRYGIEYVEDPKTSERIPTCHRVQNTSILSDQDYIATLQHAADEYTKSLYEEEAKKIAEIQKNILAISNKEEPYDVFICYKETTDGGSRTIDSTIAQDIYYQLTHEGYKVFFAKITLEDKLGQQYEPYIFAALNSAKVMLVVATKKEHFEAIWVKNEWSRYIALMKNDRTRLLIPCYKDMDPYDIPDQLANLQSQDMAKIGFIQDIIRGVKKVIDANKKTTPHTTQTHTTQTTPAAPGIDSYMKRAWIFLEDADFKQADEYFDKVLDIDPEYAPAYIGKLCVNLRIKTEKNIENHTEPIAQNSNYQKALRFANETYRAQVEEYNKTIVDRIAEKRRIEAEKRAEEQKKEEQRKAQQIEIQNSTKYHNLLREKEKATTENEFKQLSKLFREMSYYQNAATLAQQCEEQAIILKNEREQREAIRRKERIKKQKIVTTISAITIAIIISIIAIATLIRNIQIAKAREQAAKAWEQTAIAEVEQIRSQIAQKKTHDTIKFADREWLILEKRDNYVLIISKNIIGDRQYHRARVSITWAHSSLRAYLNGEFYDTFATAHKEIIAEVTNTNPNHSNGTPGGASTRDKIFLLSRDEANRYFQSDQQRIAKYDDGNPFWWWLRSPGYSTNMAANVYGDGYLYEFGLDVHITYGGVRPALWLKL